MNTNKIGIISSLCPEPFAKLLEAKIAALGTAAEPAPEVVRSAVEWTKIENPRIPLVAEADVKMQAFEEAVQLADKNVAVIAVPHFASLKWIGELQTEILTPIASIAEAIGKSVEAGTRIGFLGTADSEKAKVVTEAIGKFADIEWVYLDDAAAALIEELHAGCKCGCCDKAAVFAKLEEACRYLVNHGATTIIPPCGYMAAMADELHAKGLPVLDVAEIYAKFLVSGEWKQIAKPFKLGLVGGLGPAATVDLYDKFTKATPAANDQEHFKVVIEQNPQIPDRTQYLLNGGVDPTLALYAACKRLEADGVDAILIPCNTAHAFFEAIGPKLRAPIINMQQVTLEEIENKYGKDCVIGLLATNGTCQTGIYSRKAEEMGLKLVTPDAEFQKLVMSAIYGPKGAKAGYTDGVCREELVAAGRHLVRDKGANVLILGCTELPLILDECESLDLGEGFKSAVVDPTATLARRAAKIAAEISKIRGRK